MFDKKNLFVLNKLLQILVKKGKKAYALKIFLLLLQNLKYSKISDLSAPEIIFKSLNNVKPLLHIKKVKKSSKIFYLPKLITTEEKINIALHWIMKSVSNRKENKLSERLTNEFLDCFSAKGSSLAKKRSLYETILVNRPFLHLLLYK